MSQLLCVRYVRSSVDGEYPGGADLVDVIVASSMLTICIACLISTATSLA